MIDWDNIPESNRGEGFDADLVARVGNRDVRVPFNGGWLNYQDATHTSGSPQAVLADTSTPLTIDGLGANTVDDYRRSIGNDIWASSTFNPAKVGEAYMLRLTLSVSKSVSSNEWIEIDLGIGSGYSNIIASERQSLIKGSGVTDKKSFLFPIYCLDEFGSVGGRFFILSSAAVNVWGKAIFIQRTFTP